MKTDRELLELAAKAAGLDYEWKQEGYFYGETGVVPQEWRRCWNPLANDGDALRLAVKLGLFGVQSYNGDDYAKANKCPYAATRRAIVRAAAAIGEGSK